MLDHSRVCISPILPQLCVLVSDIKSFEDIRGKRIAVGQPGNSIQTVLTHDFRSLGVEL